MILKWKSTTKIIIIRNIFDANVAAYTFWALFFVLNIITNHITSFILREKIVWIRFINEYSFYWYQFIIVSFDNNFSNFLRFNNVVFHLRNFEEFLSMRMSQHNSSMQKRFRQIADMKFKRRCRFYFEFWHFRIENNHHCCVKYKNSRHFFVDSSRVRKISWKFSNSFFSNDVNNIYSRIDIFRCQHVQWSILCFEKLFRWFHEFEQKNFSCEKKYYFLCLMIDFFEKN